MPTYEYKCEKCSNIFEEFLSMDERDQPLDKPCPQCGAVGDIHKNISGFPGVGVDFTLSADKKTGGRFSEVMKRVKESVPERMRGKFDKSTSMRGHRWKQ
jgi:putative FmdB family regulatory protein